MNKRVQPQPYRQSGAGPSPIRDLKNDRRPLVLSSTIEADLTDIDLTAEEGFFLSRIDGTSHTAGIISTSPISELETALVLMSLLEKGLMRFEAG